MKKAFLFTLMLVLAFTANIKAFAQTAEQAAEISSTVPELQAFHTVIFPMWHKAYPAKDTAALKSFVPKIKENMEKINKAKLSGILRDKEEQWKSELVKFNAVSENYYKACAGNDETAILKAAENLHRGYEAMNRVVKPFIPEMDSYHQTLYIIYHKLYPKKDYKAISALMDKFVSQAEALTKTPQDKLERRLKDKTPKYYQTSKELYDSTVALKDALDTKGAKEKAAAMEKLHNTYKKLEAVFE